jgi:hypothetical protein
MRKQFSAALLAAALVSVGVALPARAAAPGNDTLAGATPITVPFSEVVDTSEATTDSFDATLNDQCGAPATNGSVWYTFTAPAGLDGITVDVSESNFSAGVLIAESDGSGGWYVDACGPGSTGTPVYEGAQYAIMAFSDNTNVTGGSLHISVAAATVPSVSLTVNPKGKVDRSGNALISGTYTCSGADWVGVQTSLKQAVGRFAIQGDGWADSSTCDGSTQPWTAIVFPYNGKFAGGKAASFSFAFACGSVFCGDSYVEKTIKLSK